MVEDHGDSWPTDQQTVMMIIDLPTFYQIKAEDLTPLDKKCGRFVCSQNIVIFYLPVTHKYNDPIFRFQHHRNNETGTKYEITTLLYIIMYFICYEQYSSEKAEEFQK